MVVVAKDDPSFRYKAHPDLADGLGCVQILGGREVRLVNGATACLTKGG